MTPPRVAQTWQWLGRLLGLVAFACAVPVLAQSPLRLPQVTPSDAAVSWSHPSEYALRASLQVPQSNLERLPQPQSEFTVEAVPAPQPSATGPIVVPSSGGDKRYPIDLAAALRLADRANPEIGISREAIEESLAALLRARVILLPSLTGGTNYHQHNGNLQRAGGAILGLSEQALYVGGGAQTVGAQTIVVPAIRVLAHVGDAIFEPLAARQQTTVRRFEAGATFNSVLLNVSTRYIELMAAEAQLEALHRSQRDAAEAVRISTNFARVGEGRQADANRMQTEASLIDSEVQHMQELAAVAAAELAQLLNLDPSVGLKTVGGPMPILQLVDPNNRLEQLIDVAVRQRPELAANNASIAEAETRYRQERMRPLLPTVSVGFSAGDFGGGSNLVVPTFGSFAGRTDFDAIAFWTLQNVGVGNAALWRGRRAQTDQAIATRTRTLNLVRRQVAEAHAQATARRQEVKVNEKRLSIAEAGYAEELRRVRGGEGLPIELFDSFTRLVAAREALVGAISAYDQAQFRLFVALGQPPPLTLPNGDAFKAD